MANTFEKNIVTTAQDKLRDEFFNFDTINRWEVIQTGAGQVISTAGALNGARYLNIATGTTINSETIIQSRETFKLPVKVAFGLSMSQRIVNQEVFVELVSVGGNNFVETDATFPSTNLNDATNAASLKFDGTVATSASYITRGFATPELNSGLAALVATTVATGTGPNFIPAGVWEINADMEEVVFNTRPVDSLAAVSAAFKRTQNLPDPSKDYKVRIRVRNLGTAPASTTDVRLHFIRLLDTTRFTVDFARHMGRTTDIADSLPVSIANTPAMTVSSGTITTVSALTGGGAAEDAAAGANPVTVGGVVRTAVSPTTLIAGDAARDTMTSGAAKVIFPFSVPEVQATANLSLTTTTAQAIRAAGAAGIRNYLVGLQVYNSSATAVDVIVLDGATEVWRQTVNATSGREFTFELPLKTTAATALNVNLSAAATAVRVTAQTFQSA